MAVHGIDEIRHLLGTLRIDDPPEAGRAGAIVLDHGPRVGDDAQGHPSEERRPADHLGGMVGLELVELLPVQNARQHGTHVVGLPVVRREEIVEVRGLTSGG